MMSDPAGMAPERDATAPAKASGRFTLGLGVFGYVPASSILEIVRLADTLGVRNAWIGDSQVLWREAYTLLGAAAVQTQRIVLGTGVSNLVTRHVSVVASALQTLAELSGDRVAFGVGSGDSSIRTLGLKPATRRVLGERIQELRTLLAGDDRLERLAYAPEPEAETTRIPIYVAAHGPRTLELAGGVADGVIMCVGCTTSAVEASIDLVEAGAHAAGRSPDDVHTVLWAPVSVADRGQDARDAVRVHVAGNVNVHAFAGDLTAAEESAIEEVRKNYRYRSHMTSTAGHADPVPDSLVAKGAIAGTVDECRDHVKELATTRLRQISAVPWGPAAEDRPRVIEQFASEVFDRSIVTGKGGPR